MSKDDHNAARAECIGKILNRYIQKTIIVEVRRDDRNGIYTGGKQGYVKAAAAIKRIDYDLPRINKRCYDFATAITIEVTGYNSTDISNSHANWCDRKRVLVLEDEASATEVAS